MNGNVIVIGGGTAGMEAAGQLARAGFSVTLFEKNEETGGNAKEWCYLFPDRRKSSEVTDYLQKQIDHGNITLRKGHTVSSFAKNGKAFVIKTDKGKDYPADAIVMATGFDLFRSERKEEYGYKIYDNVITSADLEKMFRKGEILRTDGQKPGRIGLIHCVGSRDEKVGNVYCSKLCCVTAVKQAIEIREYLPESKVFCFYMDMRMGGALYEELYREAQEKYGVNFIRGKVSEVGVNIDKRLVAKVEDTLVGRPLKMELDLLVLMAGMEMSHDGATLADNSQLIRGDNRFLAPADHHFGSNKSNIKGVFYAGTCTAPMNITETISHARAAVADVIDYFKSGN
ncbi:MAG: FAD-dependent oxidoreductase [Bacteroidales bacterium]|jgi:heterodisulfide reductase subunit A|nr:FAD-dependent oxidoreductase [Bacteroidales bacterium]